MDATPEKTTKNVGKETPPESDPTKMDRAAPAGGENYLGAESVRGDRPATEDRTVRAIDGEYPGHHGSLN
jgi:hypothetical protein